MDRDNVPPSFLRDVRAVTLNLTARILDETQASANWVSEALEDERIESAAVEQVLDKRYGEMRVVYDPSDLEANRIALSTGYSVIPANAMSKDAWKNVRKFAAALPAGQVTPSPKPFHPDGQPLKLLPLEKVTAEIAAFVREVQFMHKVILGGDVHVELVDDAKWGFLGTYGKGSPAQLRINLAKLKPSLEDEQTLRTVIHEFGHAFGAHLTHAFDDGMALVAARWIRYEQERTQ